MFIYTVEFELFCPTEIKSFFQNQQNETSSYLMFHERKLVISNM